MRWIRNFFRHIATGFKQLFRNGWMTIASILTMTVTLFMAGGLFLLIQNVEKVTQDIEQDIQIRAHLDMAATQEDAKRLEEEIETYPKVTSVEFRSKEQELEDLVANVKEFDLFQGDKNPLYDVLVVKVETTEDLENVAQQIDQSPYIVQVNYGGPQAERLIERIALFRYVLAFICALLVILAVLLVSNTIRLTIFARQQEIEIMRLVGADNRFIKAPFGYEGAFIGILSGLIASLLLYGVYQSMNQAAPQLFGIHNLRLLPIFPTLWIVGGGLVILGIILGAIGARRSMGKFLKI